MARKLELRRGHNGAAWKKLMTDKVFFLGYRNKGIIDIIITCISHRFGTFKLIRIFFSCQNSEIREIELTY